MKSLTRQSLFLGLPVERVNGGGPSRSRLWSVTVVSALLVFGGMPASATQASESTIGALVTRHFIMDSFSGTSIDRSVWGWYGTNPPDDVTLTEAGGALRVDVSGSAGNDFNASLGTRCKVRVDFDAQLSFSLLVWPPQNGVWVSLMAADTGGFNVYRVSWQFGDGEAYGAYLPPEGTSLSASGNKGVLRLARRGSTWSGYYLSGLRWVPILTGVGPTGDVALSPGVFNISGATPFGGMPTTVALNGFAAFAARVVCP